MDFSELWGQPFPDLKASPELNSLASFFRTNIGNPATASNEKLTGTRSFGNALGGAADLIKKAAVFISPEAAVATAVAGQLDPKNKVQTTKENDTGVADAIENYFVRGAVVILGFIFVAVGLAMFKVPGAVQVVNKMKPPGI